MNIASRDKLTGRLYFQRNGSPYVDLGNVSLVKQNLDTGTVEQLTARAGQFQVTHEEPGNLKPRWSLKLDEHSGEALGLLNLASTAGTSFYAATYDGVLVDEITNFQLTTGSRAPFQLYVHMENNGDYTFELYDVSQQTLLAVGNAFGFLHIDTDVPLVEFDSGVNAIFHFNSDAFLTGEPEQSATYLLRPVYRYNAISEAYVRGGVKLVLQDQHPVSSVDASLAPKHELIFNAELRVTDRGEHTGEKFNEFELALLATSDVTVDSRD